MRSGHRQRRPTRAALLWWLAAAGRALARGSAHHSSSAQAAPVRHLHHSSPQGSAQAVASDAPPLARLPLEEPQGLQGYYAEASANLSSARSGLYKRILRLYSDELLRQHPDAGWEGSEASYEPGEPQGHDRFGIWQPQIGCPGGRAPIRYGGAADGGKWLCPVSDLQAPCTILSLGSCWDTTFEEAMLEATPCAVHTFDCTVDLPALQGYEGRHAFHKKCLAEGAHTREGGLEYVTLEQAAALAGAPQGPDLLKMDIETYEHGLLGAWSERTQGLPRQLAVEVHYTPHTGGAPLGAYLEGREALLRTRATLTAGELGVLAGHLANLGFGLMSREDNPESVVCSELTFVRVEHFVPSKGASPAAKSAWQL